MARRRYDGVGPLGPLAAGKPQDFFDPVERHLGGAMEHREHRPVAQKCDRVVAPFAGGDLAAIEIEYPV